MALFSRKSTTAKTSKVQGSAAKSKTVKNGGRPVILGPRLTEKAIIANEQNTYVFNVTISSTKPEIAAAIKSLYKVEPVAVKVVTVPAKTKRRGRYLGRTNRGRKAYVTLKAGQTIELV